MTAHRALKYTEGLHWVSTPHCEGLQLSAACSGFSDFTSVCMSDASLIMCVIPQRDTAAAIFGCNSKLCSHALYPSTALSSRQPSKATHTPGQGIAASATDLPAHM